MQDTELIRYHLSMLADAARMDAFRGAIQAAVSEGDVVVDVGCGTGILSYFACEAGARRVYAIEEGPIIQIARDLARTNGFADRVTFLDGRSFDVDVPERADVLISETLWNFGLGEGILATLSDASQRWLKPRGAILPESFAMWLAPGVVGPDMWFDEAYGAGYGLDFSRLEAATRGTVHRLRVDADHLLGPFEAVGEFWSPYDLPPSVRLGGTLEIATAGPLDSLVGGFRATLWDGVEVSNLPPEAAWSWAQAVFPIHPVVPVEPGDRLTAELTTSALDETIWSWAWRVERAGAVVAEGRHSTDASDFHFAPLAA